MNRPDSLETLTLAKTFEQFLVLRFGFYHMDRTHAPKPLTYQMAFDPEKTQEEREEGNEAKEGIRFDHAHVTPPSSLFSL